MVTFTGEDGRAVVSHSSHPHPLKLVATGGALFQCDGCRQIGDELRYRCDQCDFDLHVCCAQAPAVLEHPMFEGRALTFFQRRPAIPAGGCALCDVCGDPVLGFLYHNREHDVDIHPFCATLPERIGVEDDGVLNLTKAAGHSCKVCGEVGRRGRYLSYRSQDDDGQFVYIHVACVLEASFSSGDHAVQANSTTTGEVSDRRLVTLEDAPRRTGRFRRFCKVAFRVASVSYSVATLNPVGLVSAIVS
jgi:hypothetical protein